MTQSTDPIDDEKLDSKLRQRLSHSQQTRKTKLNEHVYLNLKWQWQTQREKLSRWIRIKWFCLSSRWGIGMEIYGKRYSCRSLLFFRLADDDNDEDYDNKQKFSPRFVLLCLPWNIYMWAREKFPLHNIGKMFDPQSHCWLPHCSDQPHINEHSITLVTFTDHALIWFHSCLTYSRFERKIKMKIYEKGKTIVQLIPMSKPFVVSKSLLSITSSCVHDRP